jgi:hypothetical protein
VASWKRGWHRTAAGGLGGGGMEWNVQGLFEGGAAFCVNVYGDGTRWDKVKTWSPPSPQGTSRKGNLCIYVNGT